MSSDAETYHYPEFGGGPAAAALAGQSVRNWISAFPPLDPPPSPSPSSASAESPAPASPSLSATELRGLLAAEGARVIRAIEAVGAAVMARQSADYETTFYVNSVDTALSYEGKRHLLIWVNAAQAGVSLHVPEIGIQSGITLAAGWTVLDPPRGARILATTPFACKVRCTDHVPAGLI